jgi:hypothetical protein
MKTLAFLLLLLPVCSFSQTDLLMLKKNGQHVITYSEGMEINMETIYQQWFEGTISAIRHDSIFLDGTPFHYKEIMAIQRQRKGLNYKADGIILMAAGGAWLVIGAVNGLYRGDPANTWITPAGYIIAGTLIAGGFALTRLETKKYVIGKKYTLEYLNLDPHNNPGRSF